MRLGKARRDEDEAGDGLCERSIWILGFGSAGWPWGRKQAAVNAADGWLCFDVLVSWDP